MSARAQQLNEIFQQVDSHIPGQGLAKHKKMATSPFVFLRGASSIFYADIDTGVLNIPEPMLKLPLTAVMGDCHISNFGFFSEEGSHGDQIIFAPNDFDDACIGHASWDLMRFAVSLILCADHCQGIKDGRYTAEEAISKKVVSAEATEQALATFFQTYLDSCQQLLDGNLDYDDVLEHVPEKHILYKPFIKAQNRICGGSDFSVKSALSKAIDLNQTPLGFRAIEDRFQRLEKIEYAAVTDHFAPYVDDQIIDTVTRLGAGTGSVNMQRYYLLVGPSPEAKPEQWPLYHIVEIKKQRPAAPLFIYQHLSPINRLNPAHLTVVCQRRMQRNPDLVLDEVEWRGAHWLVRSRHHAKVGIDPEDISCGKKACKGGFSDYAASCARSLALAHARGDRRSNLFERAVAQQMPNSLKGMQDQAWQYAEQVKKDWAWLKQQECL